MTPHSVAAELMTRAMKYEERYTSRVLARLKRIRSRIRRKVELIDPPCAERGYSSDIQYLLALVRVHQSPQWEKLTSGEVKIDWNAHRDNVRSTEKKKRAA